MPSRRSWNSGRREQLLTKAVSPNFAEMARRGGDALEPRAFPLLDAINAATGEIMANGGPAGFMALPRDPSNDNAFGPMDPLRPEAIDRLDSDGRTEPRIWQFPVGWNLPGNGNRETPWAVLRAAAAGVGIIRRCIEARKKDVSDLAFVFAPSEDAINDAYQKNPAAGRLDAEQKLREELMPELARLREFWANPWRSRSWDFKQWCRAVLEHVLVDDGVPVYSRRTYGGDVYDLEVIDPATIKPLLDTRGSQPLPPYPAFQQVLYGFPRGEWAATVEYDEQGNALLSNGFLSSEMMYYVANTRSYSPFGFSPVEQALFDSRLYLQRQKWMIAEYDDGSTPLTWVETAAPSDGQQMTLTQQKLWEKAFNARLSGNTRERHRVKVLPNGWKAMQMTSTDERYKPEYDLYLIKLLASHFGVTATRLGFGETNGLGGSGFSESQMAVTGELGLKPDTEVLTSIINKASCHFLGMDKRITGVFVDPAQANGKEQIDGAIALQGAAATSVNETRQKLGQSLLPFEEANMPFVIGGPQGIIFLEGAKATIEAAVQAQQMAAETQALGTAGKLGIEEKKLEDGQAAREEGREFAREEREAAAELEVKKAVELRAFRVWRTKPANAGDEPRRPFIFKAVEPDDGYELLEGLSPAVAAFDGWEWCEWEDIEKAAKAKLKSPFDYIGWNASPQGIKHPKGPNGRWVKVGSELHQALIAEGERHAKVTAPKTGAPSDASTSIKPMKIQAFTIPRSETGTGREKHKVFLPDGRTGNIHRAGGKVVLADESTDEPIFNGSSVADVWNKISAHYGMPVEHEHEGTGEVTKYGNGSPKPTALSPAMERVLKERASNGVLEGAPSTLEALERLGMAQRGPSGLYRATPHGIKAVSAKHLSGSRGDWRSEADANARARQARIDAVRPRAEFLAEVEEALISEMDSAALRRTTEQSMKRNKLDDDADAAILLDYVKNHDRFTIDRALSMVAARMGVERMGHMRDETYNPRRHQPVGDPLRKGQPVELVRPGYIFRDGNEEIQLMSAMVDGRISEPQPGRELAAGPSTEPGIDSASFVTSAVNAHSLRRGDMVVIQGRPASITRHMEEGSVVVIELDDGRKLSLGLNEPVRRVHGGNLRKAAVPDDGPGDADPKAQGSAGEPTPTTPPPPPDARWPGWLLDTAIAALWASAIWEAMPGLPIGDLLRLFRRLQRTWPQGLPTWREMEPQARRGTVERVVWEMRQDGWPNKVAQRIARAIENAHIEGAYVGQQVGQAVAEAVQAGRDPTGPALELSIDWNGWEPGHPEAARLLLEPGGLERLLRESGVVSNRLADGRVDQIGRIIGEGLANGDPPRKIGQRLAELFGDRDWAYMTALTEMNRAMSAASVNQYRDAGMLYKGWMDAFDQRVCPVCANNARLPNGKPRIVPINENFPSGDPYPPGHPRCRCAPIPILSIDLAKALNVAQWNAQNPKHLKDAEGRWTRGGAVSAGIRAVKAKLKVREVISENEETGVIDEHVASAVAEFFTVEYGGLRTGGVKVFAPVAGETRVTGVIYDADGEDVGKFNRSYELGRDGSITAHHNLLRLDEELQGQGFAQAFNRHLSDWYRESGVSRIELTANIDVGGYAWARAGYDWADKASADTIQSRAAAVSLWGVAERGEDGRIPADRLEEQKAFADLIWRRLRNTSFDADDFPTPFEVAQMGRWEGAGRDDWWAGKVIMMGSAWEAVRHLESA